MSTNQNKDQTEEIDLGSILIIIGNAFSNFFTFIGKILKDIFHFIIAILLFLKKNIIKIVVAGGIGLLVGIFLEVKKEDVYGSELLVEPNFKSARQLYNNVNYYNDLVKQKDTALISKTFNLDKYAAGALQKFTIEPIRKENDIIEAYNDLILAVDTLTIKSYEYEDFKNSYTDYDYKIHKINVISKRNNDFKKIGDVIISSIIENEYFSRSKKILNENLNKTDSLYRKNLIQLDTLRKVYMKVMVEESKKQFSGTNIDLGGEQQTTRELELFEANKKLVTDLTKLAKDKSDQYQVINVISNFQPVGYKIQGFTKNYAFILTVLGAGIMVLALLLIQLNSYLDTYKK